MLKELIQFFVFKLVKETEKVSISQFEVEGKSIIEIKVAPQDLEKIIGREGRTFKALRNLVSSINPEKNPEIVIDIAA